MKVFDLYKKFLNDEELDIEEREYVEDACCELFADEVHLMSNRDLLLMAHQKGVL